ncbi:MAG: N-acetylmuramoyl-L-alanine amidase, partial [Nocardioides sp.]|nr:N-acetylmuramoyl-L-alanine amidase [Nocardioides sp.]
MTPNRSRFVTACQQVLAVGVVLAALTPAASVVTLDVVGTSPGGGTALARPTAYTAEALRPSRVPTAPVKPDVREVQLTVPGTPAARPLPTASARISTGPAGRSTLTSTAQSVTGFGEVGVTWAAGVSIPQAALHVAARTSTNGVWTHWSDVPYDPAHGPDPGSAEARHARPGTEPVLVGNVDQVQVKVVVPRPLPADMKLAVIGPGKATRTADERAAIDTSRLDTASLAAAAVTPEPMIYSRAQWGADESLRSKSSLHYGDIHAGFVHHTVNANNYTRAEVPGIIRSIYAYHVLSRGWSDIGYNFLIDRFGRIWEGRYGGVDRPVVGAHTLGYNDDSFGASAIGNYQIARPSTALIQAFAALFAWKLSLHGVYAASRHQFVTSRWFQAINGHRDAEATLCPGRYLYNKLPAIRRLAATDQRGSSGRQLESDIASTKQPDIVVRRARGGEAFVVPTGGLIRFQGATDAATGVSGATRLVVTPDLTGDGRNDLLVRR